MIAKCFTVMIVFSFGYSILFGDTASLTSAIISGASRSITLSLELCGMSCLWCGIMEVFRDFGFLDALERVMSPILKHLFPETWKSGEGKREITSAVSANLLGIGNAATPYAIAAMKKLDKANPHPKRLSRDMAAFVVLGTSSLNLIPTTVITLLGGGGCADPYRIIIPTWICSFVCAAVGMLLVGVFGKQGGRSGGKL